MSAPQGADLLARRARVAAFIRTMTNAEITDSDREQLATRILAEELAATAGNVSPLLRELVQVVRTVAEQHPTDLASFLEDRISAALLDAATTPPPPGEGGRA